MLHLGEGRAGVFGEAHAKEALTEHVLDDVNEGDVAGPALNRVQPVPCPGVIDDVAFAAQGNVDAVEGVVGEGNEDESPLEDADQGQRIEEPDLGGVGGWPFECFKVGEDVLDEEGADGDDAGEGVQLAQQEGIALASAERFYTAGGVAVAMDCS